MLQLIEHICTSCDGSGETYKKQVCPNCKGAICYRCEQYGSIKLYQECVSCGGYGQRYFDKKTGKQQFLYAINDYTILSTKNIVKAKIQAN